MLKRNAKIIRLLENKFQFKTILFHFQRIIKLMHYFVELYLNSSNFIVLFETLKYPDVPHFISFNYYFFFFFSWASDNWVAVSLFYRDILKTLEVPTNKRIKAYSLLNFLTEATPLYANGRKNLFIP